MKKLELRDAFALARIIKATEIKDKLKEIMIKAEAKKAEIANASENAVGELQNEIGFDFIMEVMSKACEVGTERMIYDMLANPFECTADEVGAMAFDELRDKFAELAKINNLTNFFKSVGKLI